MNFLVELSEVISERRKNQRNRKRQTKQRQRRQRRQQQHSCKRSRFCLTFLHTCNSHCNRTEQRLIAFTNTVFSCDFLLLFHFIVSLFLLQLLVVFFIFHVSNQRHIRKPHIFRLSIEQNVSRSTTILFRGDKFTHHTISTARSVVCIGFLFHFQHICMTQADMLDQIAINSVYFQR